MIQTYYYSTTYTYIYHLIINIYSYIYDIINIYSIIDTQYGIHSSQPPRPPRQRSVKIASVLHVLHLTFLSLPSMGNWSAFFVSLHDAHSSSTLAAMSTIRASS
eukprot:GHVO01012801.1.p1 GENE.GHVO01012801.1~~GHVO01012801.1.p1  ORF type:complete len:104 (+),score=1.36 GHVO01012801.1:162-473(+)